ncbi:MAG: family 10 glycosylhydrolase [Candidatus Bathyarchaeia archaeon]
MSKIFDNCDSLENWLVYSSKLAPEVGDNTIQLDTIDKVEGVASLKMTFAATGSNWGGYFARSGSWNLKNTPVLRIRFKAYKPLPAYFSFGIRSGGLELGSGYDILDKITAIGEWLAVDIDLRKPRDGEMFPDLTSVVWIEFASWDTLITEPTSFNIDYIEAVPGPTIPLEARITPESAWTEVGVSASFKVDVKGGVEPYSYAWYVNGTRQHETSNTLTHTPTTAGTFTINCIITDASGSSITVNATLKAVVVSPPPPSPPSIDVFKSDIRGVFIHNWQWRNPDWTTIAQACLNYGINTAFLEVDMDFFLDSSTGQVKDNPTVRTAINAFHSKGINVHLLFLFGCAPGENPATYAVDSSGNTVTWLCFTKNASRQLIKKCVENIATNYDIDGFMFDYIRWSTTEMCFCNECKAKFIADTGLSNVRWPSDCVEGGRYYWQFIQWRMTPVTEMVRDVVQWMKDIRPNLLFSAAVFTAFEDCGNYWCVSIGQHTADWIDKGYLDFVSPMIYTDNAADAVSNMLDSMNFYTGGAEGKIPMVPFITFLQMPDEFTPMPVEAFVNVVRGLKQNGADGWIIWRYGGPGFENDPFRKFADIRAHLAALINEGLMPPVWAIQNLQVISINATHVTISWTTTVPTDATIEYINGKIFYANIRYGDFGRPIYYKDIEYNGTNTKKIYNSTYSTEHSFTMTLTDLTQFRIQCKDINGVTITTKPMTKSEITQQ